MHPARALCGVGFLRLPARIDRWVVCCEDRSRRGSHCFCCFQRPYVFQKFLRFRGGRTLRPLRGSVFLQGIVRRSRFLLLYSLIDIVRGQVSYSISVHIQYAGAYHIMSYS